MAEKKKYVSKGQRPNVTKKISNSMRSDYLQSSERTMNQLRAMRKGKRTLVTIPNPNKNDTRARFIKISGKEWFREEYLKKDETVQAAS